MRTGSRSGSTLRRLVLSNGPRSGERGRRLGPVDSDRPLSLGWPIVRKPLKSMNVPTNGDVGSLGHRRKLLAIPKNTRADRYERLVFRLRVGGGQSDYVFGGNHHADDNR